jgi:hypothetical protein
MVKYTYFLIFSNSNELILNLKKNLDHFEYLILDFD